MVELRESVEWLFTLLNYLKVKTLVAWLHHFPGSSYEDFEQVWPTFLIQMFNRATCYTMKKLHETISESLN
ncbi:MAG: hypothetical protein AUG51_17050 [Acidobacteria bacterium 13_1_20CM_3_53_8]|nr:MAG: hypothetical protein AUG51_17050 [Acidobacteria bacterium 13_1_20CM_3_53_8]